jgi:hypothetical protein
MGASSKGFGGGAGGGVGGGIGPGRGGGRNMVSLFGASGFNVAGLSGALYDCKQTPSGQFRDPGVGGYVGYVTKFLNSGFDVSFLQSKFYQSKEKLALQQVYIPMMDANGAPAAFNCQKEVKPSRWIVHYKGSVTAPFSGRMRFVGMADDWIAVKFNNKTALLSGYGNSIDGAKYPGKTPPPGVGGSYEYGGGRPPFRTGPWIDVREGTSYPIEVAMGETPGGQFCAALAFQKGSENSPLLLFRMTGDKDFNAVLKASKGGHFPPNVDLSGGKYVWKPKMANNNRRSR